MRAWRAAALVLLALVAFWIAGQAQFLRLDPRLRWQVLETEHFSVVFPPGTEGLARESARLAEAAWQYWKRELSYSPPGKTAIVIVPGADFDIGGASTIPNNEIMIRTSEARTFSEWLNSRARSGLEQVIYHEYGHIVDIGKVSGLSRLLRAVFGTIIMPNGFKPGFFTEGVVISAEYRRSGESRSNDPRDAMYLRELWLHDTCRGSTGRANTAMIAAAGLPATCSITITGPGSFAIWRRPTVQRRSRRSTDLTPRAP